MITHEEAQKLRELAEEMALTRAELSRRYEVGHFSDNYEQYENQVTRSWAAFETYLTSLVPNVSEQAST